MLPKVLPINYISTWKCAHRGSCPDNLTFEGGWGGGWKILFPAVLKQGNIHA